MDIYEIIEKVFWWILYPGLMILMIAGIVWAKIPHRSSRDQEYHDDKDYKYFFIISNNGKVMKWLRGNSNRIMLTLLILIIVLTAIEYVTGDKEFVKELIGIVFFRR